MASTICDLIKRWKIEQNQRRNKQSKTRISSSKSTPHAISQATKSSSVAHSSSSRHGTGKETEEANDRLVRKGDTVYLPETCSECGSSPCDWLVFCEKIEEITGYLFTEEKKER